MPPRPHPLAGACSVPLFADCLKQLGSGLIITPATISSPAAVPALRAEPSNVSDAQLATLLPSLRVTLFNQLRLFATSSLDTVLHYHHAPP